MTLSFCDWGLQHTHTHTHTRTHARTLGRIGSSATAIRKPQEAVGLAVLLL